MNRNFRALIVAGFISLMAIAVQAQTDVCPTAVAEMIAPLNGTTLQPNPATGAIDFHWCNASADYFVIVESVLGAHDIFFAFTGGAGGGAGQNFLSLGPACNIPSPTNPTTQCIPSHGETIIFTLQTVKAKQILGAFQYVFTAPNSTPAPPAATTVSVENKTVSASSSAQSVTLTATVAGGTVNQGTVTFQVVDGAGVNIGAAVTSATLSNGSASVNYALPAATAANTYTIQAGYSGGTNFQASAGSGTLTVTAPAAAPAATATTVDAQSVTFSSGGQNATLTATVAAASAVNEGTVTFQLMDGAANVGTAATSATLSNGSASAIYALPAGLAAGTYTIQAAYSGGSNFLASSNSGILTVSAAPPATQAVTATTVGNNALTFSGALQHVTLSAAVSVAAGTVDQGTVTFQVMDGAVSIGAPVPSAKLTNGSASVNYDLPARMAARNYTIQATYSGGTNFLASSGSGTLTINKGVSTTNFSSTAPATLANHATYTPTASSTGDGTLSVSASGACSFAGGVVTMTASSGTCTVTATESEGANFLGSSTTQSIAAKPGSAPDDYRLDASSRSLTIARGQSGSVQITLTPTTSFAGTVTFSCAGLPANVRCQFTPAPLAGSPDGKPLTSTLVISADSVVALNRNIPSNRHPGWLLAFWNLGAGAIGMVFTAGVQVRRRTRWSKRWWLLGLGCGLMLVLLVGCGGGAQRTTQPQAATPQSFSTVVTASFASATQPAPTAAQQVQLQIMILP